MTALIQPRSHPPLGTAEPSPDDATIVTAGPSPDLDAVVDVVVPIHNEQDALEASVRRLDAYLAGSFPYPYAITIADNASTDASWEIAARLTAELPRVRAIRLTAKGRGRALRYAWSHSASPVLAYMDVDLSTDLRALLPLVAPLISGHSDVAIGTRLSRGSRVVRGAKREFISRSYNLLLRGTLAASFSDAQCGFKAVRRPCATELLPMIEDNNWFFDTELLVLAERGGLRIHEVPVDWVDDPGSTVDIVATAKEDLRGILRLGRGLVSGRIPVDRLRAEIVGGRTVPATVPGVPRGLLGQLIRFGGVGVLSTLAYFALYLGMRDLTGPQTANFVALLLTAVANTAANRRLTFGVTGRVDVLKHQVGGLVAFGVGLALTSGSLWLLHTWFPDPNRGVEVGALVLANAVSTLVRFLALRQLMARRPATASDPGATRGA